MFGDFTEIISLRHLFILFFSACVFFSLTSHRFGSPVSAIFSRWCWWLFVTFFTPVLILSQGWIDRPYWVLAAVSCLGWLLLVTFYNWMLINAMSRSPYPLFPKFKENDKGDEWPAQKRFLKMRDHIRSAGFTKLKSLKAELDEHLVWRICVFQDSRAITRLQVMFLPGQSGRASVCFIFTSVAARGTRLITDNFFLPFGGFYPDHWRLSRNPWNRSFQGLWRRHRKRMEELGEEFLPWKNEPETDLNNQQRQIEKINTELGFLVPLDQREEHGKLTWEGRYRVWKELWLLNYLGLSISY